MAQQQQKYLKLQQENCDLRDHQKVLQQENSKLLQENSDLRDSLHHFKTVQKNLNQKSLELLQEMDGWHNQQHVPSQMTQGMSMHSGLSNMQR